MSDIPEDLRWAAENIKDWPFGVTLYFGVSKPEWQAARQQLEQERNSEGEDMSDDKWSAWIDNKGDIPLKFLGKVVSVKYRDGVINDGVIAGAFFDDSGSCPERNAGDWKIDNVGGDIIAYRYRLDDSAQTPEENRMDIIGQNGNGGEHYDVFMTEEEEEQIKLEEDRNGNPIKQTRCLNEEGRDWIDECAATMTVDEFRGAMKFTIGKYLRRAGKKDQLESEIAKIADYARRWAEYEAKINDL